MLGFKLFALSHLNEGIFGLVVILPQKLHAVCMELCQSPQHGLHLLALHQPVPRTGGLWLLSTGLPLPVEPLLCHIRQHKELLVDV